jgi:SNF2 family DNA or RNA helicase
MQIFPYLPGAHTTPDKIWACSGERNPFIDSPKLQRSRDQKPVLPNRYRQVPRDCFHEDSQVNFKIEPWAHQKEAMRRAKDLPGFALFFEMGAGKTGTTINILREKFNTSKRVLRTIIFCPPIVCKNWKDEWAKHSTLEPRKVILLTGSGKDRMQTFLRHALDDGGVVFITNYESLLMKDLYTSFVEWAPEALVYDESHKLKAHDSKRSKLAAALSNANPRPLVYILSGSPVLNSPMDLFQQYKVLDGGETFGDNFFGFRHRYFNDANARWKGTSSKYFPKWEIAPGSIDEINRMIFRRGMSVKKAECLDLPPLVQQSLKVDMSPEQAKAYNELAQEYITFIEDDAVSASLAIVKALRLMQIASGFVSLDAKGEEGDPIKHEFKANPKLEALRELLEELTPHSKVIIWAVWKQNYEQIGGLLKELGLDYVSVHGGISEAAKREAVERFNSDPSVRCFVGHPGSGGIGINLKAPYSVFYSRTFSLEHSLQAEARNHRGDSKAWGFDKITRYDLVCEGTIDEEVVTKLTSKLEVSNALLKTLVKKFRAN